MESHFLKGKEQDSLTCYNHALRVIKFHLGTLHPALLDAHNAVARLYYSSKKYPQALEYYNKCLNLANKILGINHPLTASYCNKCGHTFKNLNDYPRALAMYERALLIYNTVLGPNTLTVAHSYFSVSSVLAAKGDYEKALEYALKSLTIRERILSQKHPLTLASYYQVAFTADRLDNYQLAIPYFEKLLSHLKMIKVRSFVVGLTWQDESVIKDIQNITSAIIKLKFRNLVPTQRIILEKVQAHNTLKPASHAVVLETVIAKLYKYNPSEYVEELLVTAGSTVRHQVYVINV